jgi:hypothetical protein
MNHPSKLHGGTAKCIEAQEANETTILPPKDVFHGVAGTRLEGIPLQFESPTIGGHRVDLQRSDLRKGPGGKSTGQFKHVKP